MSKFSDLLSRPLPSAANNLIGEACECGVMNELDTVNTITPAVTPEVPVQQPAVEPEVIPTVGSDEADVPELTPDESKHVDDMLDVIATPILLKAEIDSEESFNEFVESTDADIAEAEGFLTERTIVKFDKNARKAQLYEVALFTVAREHNDPLYRKLETVNKMRRILKAKLNKKYHSQATKKMKEYLARAKKSKSGILARIAAKITGKNK